MSLFNTGFLKNISNWTKGFGTGKPSVDTNNSIEILYSRNFDEAFQQTITIDHLDSAGNIIETKTLLDSKSGKEHDLVAKVYGDYKVNVTNNAASEFYFSLYILSEYEGYKEEFSLEQLVAGSTKSTPVLTHPSKALASKETADWLQRKATPFVNSANVELIYSHSQSATLSKSLIVQHLNSEGVVIAEDLLIDNLTGNSHRATCKVYGDFQIKTVNESGSFINYSIDLLNDEGITQNVYSLTGIGAGSEKTSSVIAGKIKSKEPVYKVIEEATFGFDSLVVDGVTRRIFSITVDYEGNVLLGGTQGRPPALSKYTPDGGLVWSRDVLETGIAIGNIFSLSTDSNGNIYAGDGLGRLYKVPSNGAESEWKSASFGTNQSVLDSHVDSGNNIYAVGGLYVRKYDVEGTLLWEYEFGASSTARTIDLDSDGNVYVGVRDLGTTNKIVKFDQSAANDTTPPTITWQETVTNNPDWLRIGPDDSIYYQDIQKIIRVNQDGAGFTNTVFTVSANISPNKIKFVIDRDGNAYVINAGGDKSVVAKYSKFGNLLWQVDKKHTRTEMPIALDTNEDVYYAAWGKVTKLKADLQLTGYSNK